MRFRKLNHVLPVFSVLSDGAIAGIVVGAVVLVALVIIVPVVVCMK